MVDALNKRMLREVIDYLFGILGVALNSEREGFETLQEKERVERRKRGAGISEENSSDICYKRRTGRRLCKYSSVV